MWAWVAVDGLAHWDGLPRHPSSFPQPLCALSLPGNPGWLHHSHCTQNWVPLCSLLANLRAPVGASSGQHRCRVCSLVGCTVAPPGTAPDCPSSFQVAEGQGEASFPFRHRMRAQGLAAATLGVELRKGEARCAFLHPRWVLHLEMGTEAGSLSPAVSHVSATCEGHCLSLQSWRWSWELMEVRQRKGGDSYLTWFQSGNRIIWFIPLCNLPKSDWSKAKHYLGCGSPLISDV